MAAAKQLSPAQAAFRALLCLVLCFGLSIPTAALSAIGSAQTAWAALSPNADGVYEISTEADLNQLATDVNGGNTYVGKTVVLTADIALTGTFTPIGSSSTNCFAGTFDGQGHTISGLKTTAGSSRQALFSYAGGSAAATKATIKNLTVKGDVTGKMYSAAIVAWAGYLAMENVAYWGTVTTTSAYTGGLVCWASQPVTLDSCSFNGTIANTHTGANAHIGGLVGYMGQTGNVITGCWVTGTLTGSTRATSGAVGGLVGLLGSSAGCSIYKSYAAVSITTKYANTSGALVGSATAANSHAGTTGGKAYFENCYFDSTLYSRAMKGGAATNAKGLATATLKTTVVSDLSDYFVADKINQNNGYPVLSWQAPDYSPEVTGPTGPVGGFAPAGSSYALGVSATASNPGTITYQWHKVSASGLDTEIAGATSANYTATVDSTNGTTSTYYCVVTNTVDGTPYATESDRVALTAVTGTMPAIPSVTPVAKSYSFDNDDPTQTIGATIVLDTVPAGFSGTLSYTWQKLVDGSWTDTSTTGTLGVANGQIDGASSADVSFTPEFSAFGATQYRCVVKSTGAGYGEATVYGDAIRVTINLVQVSTPDELVAFSGLVNAGDKFTGKTVKLAANIDMSSVKNFTPIGNSASSYFAGSFDGQSHTISNLTIASLTQYTGLFGYVLGTGNTEATQAHVKNVIVEGSVSSTATATGGIVGFAKYAKFENVVFRGTVSGNGNVGGFAGRFSDGNTGYVELTSCGADVDVTNTSTATGGFVGYNMTKATFTNCYMTGTVTSSQLYIGGMYGNKSSSSCSFPATNTYIAVKVNYTGAGTGYGQIGGNSYLGSTQSPFNGVYYDSSLNGDMKLYATSTTVATSSPTPITTTDAKRPAFLKELGSAFGTAPVVNGVQLNDGYPVLSPLETPGGAPTVVVAASATGDVLNTQPVTLTATASLPAAPAAGGDGSLSYQWHKVSADGTDTVIAGATAASYTLEAGRAAETAEYYCVVTNSFTSGGVSYQVPTLSDNLSINTITTTPAATPTITTQPVGASYKQQESATALTVAASVSGAGAGVLSYQWYRMTGDAPNPSVDEPIEGATGASYVPSTATLGTQAYYCVVTNTFETTKTAQTVSAAAQITVSLLETNVIKTADELVAFATAVNGGKSYAGYTVVLDSDIDLSGVDWTPIGSSKTKCFAGTFDGQGHTIYGLSINDQANNGKGLFYYVVGTADSPAAIKNLVMRDVNVVGANNTAGLVVNAQYTDFSNVSVEGYVEGNYGVGGMIASGTAVRIDQCSFRGTVKSRNKGTRDTYYKTGGLVGFIDTTNANGYDSSVSNCYVNATVISNDYAGGLIGQAYADPASDTAHQLREVSNCYVSVDLQPAATTSNYNGYIVGMYGYNAAGYATDNLVSTNCYYDSSVSDGYKTSAAASFNGTAAAESLLSSLGSAYAADSYTENEGLPLFGWEATATPAIAADELSELAAPSEQGSLSFDISGTGDSLYDAHWLANLSVTVEDVTSGAAPVTLDASQYSVASNGKGGYTLTIKRTADSPVISVDETTAHPIIITDDNGSTTYQYSNQYKVSIKAGVYGASSASSTYYSTTGAQRSSKIVYVLNGGTNSSANPSSYVEGTTVTLRSPSKMGYSFGGWYLDAYFTQPIDMIGASTTGVVTLYAKWTSGSSPTPAPNPGTNSDGTFSDVDYSSWYADAVNFVAKEGIITGYTDGNGKATGVFGVGDTLTRAQLVTMIWRYAEPWDAKNYNPKGAINVTGLPDVEDGSYYTKAANWAVKNGVITGYALDDGSFIFAPDDAVTFEQFMVIMARYCASDSYNGSDTSVLSKFVDGAAVDGWATTGVAWAAQVGLLTGSEQADGLYVYPTTATERERAAVIFFRAYNNGIL